MIYFDIFYDGLLIFNNFRFQFRCGDNKCIFKNRVCNGVIDCRDGSDEMNCTSPKASCSPGNINLLMLILMT